MASLLDDNEAVEKAGYEHSYGHDLQKWYFDNYDENKTFQRTPEMVAQEAYRQGNRVEQGETYENWASRHKIDKFVGQTAEYEPMFLEEREKEKTRQDNKENMSGFTRGMVSGGYGLAGSALALAPLILGKVATLPTGGERNSVSDWLGTMGGGIFKHFEEKASMYPTMDLFDPNDPNGWSINPEIKSNPLSFAAEALGNVAPSIAAVAASGLTGGATLGALAANASSSGLFKKVVNFFAKKAVDKGLFATVGKEATEYAAKNMGRYIGGFSANMAMMGGDNFMKATDALQQKYLAAGVPPEEAYLRAYEDTSAAFVVTTTAAASAIDYIGGVWPKLSKLLGEKKSLAVRELLDIAQDSRATPDVMGKALNAVKNLIYDTVKTGAAEFGQEASQEFLGILNVDFADPDFQMLAPGPVKQVLAAGIAGAIGGGLSGVGMTGVQKGKDALTKTKTDDVPAEVVNITKMIANQESHLKAHPEDEARVRPLIQENEAKLKELLDYVVATDPKQGVSYADAVKLIQEKAPNPTGKAFTTKALRKLIADPENPLKHVAGAGGQEYRGTVDKASLDAFIQMRTGAVDPAAAAAAAANTQFSSTEDQAFAASEGVDRQVMNYGPGGPPAAAQFSSTDDAAFAAYEPSAVATPLPAAPAGTVTAPPAAPAGTVTPPPAAPAAKTNIAFKDLPPDAKAPASPVKATGIEPLDQAFPPEGIRFDEKSHTYTDADGKPFEGVTANISEASGADTEAIIERMTSHISDEAARAREVKRLRAEFDEKRDGGTAVHAEIEKIVRGELSGADPVKVAIVDEITDNRRLKAAGEKVIYSKELNLAGTADITVQDEEGRFRVYDVKTVDELPIDDEEAAEMGYFAGGIDSKYVKHGTQLSAYAAILESKGLKVSGKYVVLVARDGSGHKIIEVKDSDNLTKSIERAYPGRTLSRAPVAVESSDESVIGSRAIDMAMSRLKGHKNAPSREEKAKQLADLARAVGTKEGAKVGKLSLTLSQVKRFDGRPMKEIRRKLADGQLNEEQILAIFHAHGLTIDEGDNIKARKVDKPAKHMSASSIVRFVKEKLPLLFPHVVVYSSIEEVSDPAARAWLQKHKNVQGFFYNGKIYLDATMIEDVRDLVLAIAHEAVHAAEKPYLDRLMRKMGIGAGMDEWNNILDRAWTTFKEEILKLHEEGYADLYDITTVEGQRDMAREFLSEREAHSKSASLLDRLVAALRKIINSITRHMNISLKLSEAEVRVVLSDMKAALNEDLKAGKELDAIELPRAKKKESAEEKSPAPPIDVVNGEPVVKKFADLPDNPGVLNAPGPNPEMRRLDVKQPSAEELGALPERQRSKATLEREASELEAAEFEAGLTKEEVMALRYEEMDERHAKEQKLVDAKKKATDAADAEKARKKAEDFEDEKLIMIRLIEKRLANSRLQGEALDAERKRLANWLMDLRSRGVKMDERALDGALLSDSTAKAENMKKIREAEMEKRLEREREIEKKRAAIEAKAEKLVDVLLPDEELVLDPVLRDAGRKIVPGIDISELRKSIAKHSKLRFKWADYIKTAIKNENYDVLLSGVLEAFAHANLEAAMLSTYPYIPVDEAHAGQPSVMPKPYDYSSRGKVEEKEFRDGNIDLLNSAIKEMQDVRDALDEFVSKYQKGSHAAQYGDLFEKAVSRFNSSMYALYKVRKGANAEEAVAAIYKDVFHSNQRIVDNQKRAGKNNPEGEVISEKKLSWYHFPSMISYFEYILKKHRTELDDPADTLRSGLPADIKDLIAWARAVQSSISFFRGRLKDSFANALIEIAELQMLEPVESFAVAVVSDDEADNIGTAFKTLRQTGEKEDQLSEEDKRGLAITRDGFKAANDIRSAIMHVGHFGTVFGDVAAGGGAIDEQNIIFGPPATIINIVYTMAMDDMLGLESQNGGIFDYKNGQQNLLKNFEEAAVETTAGDNDRIIRAAENLGFPVENIIFPMIPRIDGVSAIDYYLEKFNEAKADDPALAELNDDEFIVAMIGIGYHNTKMRIFDPKFMSERLKEKLIGIGAIGLTKGGDVIVYTEYSKKEPFEKKTSIGKILPEPLCAMMTYPDNPRMGTFLRGALVPKTKNKGQSQAADSAGVIYADREEDKLLYAKENNDPQYLIARSFRPGAILYNQNTGGYFIVGPQIIEENGKAKYQIIELTHREMLVGKETQFRLRTGKTELLTHAQLSQRRMAVVPRVWDILSGHGQRGVAGEKGNLSAMDDYAVYTATRINSARKALREVEARTGIPVGGANYAHISRDLNGKRVLSVATHGGAVYFFQVGGLAADAMMTDVQAFERIINVVIDAARAEYLHRYRRQRLDVTMYVDADYLEDLIRTAVKTGLTAIGRLATRGEITYTQAFRARAQIKQIATIAALNLEDDNLDTLTLAEKVEMVFQDSFGSYDTQLDGFNNTSMVMIPALKQISANKSHFLPDLFGAQNTLSNVIGETPEMTMHRMGQTTSTGDDGEESTQSDVMVHLSGDLISESVEAQITQFIFDILDLEDSTVLNSKQLAYMLRLHDRMLDRKEKLERRTQVLKERLARRAQDLKESNKSDIDMHELRAERDSIEKSLRKLLEFKSKKIERVSPALLKMREDFRRRKNELRRDATTLEANRRKPGAHRARLQEAQDRLDERMKKLLADMKVIKEREEAEIAAAQHGQKEMLERIDSAKRIFRIVAELVNSLPRFIYEVNSKGEPIKSRPRHASKYFSSRHLQMLEMCRDMMQKKAEMDAQLAENGEEPVSDPVFDVFIYSYYSGIITGIMMARAREAQNLGLSQSRLRLALATILRNFPLDQEDGTYRVFSEASAAQRKAAISILGKAAFMQNVLKRQIQLSALPIDHVFTEFLWATGDVAYTDNTGKQVIAKGVPGIFELLTGVDAPENLKAHLKDKDPFGLPRIEGFDQNSFALHIANGSIHPLFGFLATGDSLSVAIQNASAAGEAAYAIRDRRVLTPSAIFYGEEHVMPDHFVDLLEEEIAERFMDKVEAAEDDANPYFIYKRAVERARRKIADELDGRAGASGNLIERKRGLRKHGDLGQVQTTVRSMRILEAELARVGGAAPLLHNILLDLPGVKYEVSSVDDVESFISDDGSKYIKMLYYEMNPEESYLSLSDVTPSTADMKIVEAINYIIPGFIKLGAGGLSGNPNHHEATKFDGEELMVVNSGLYTIFGRRMLDMLFQIINSVREMPRAFTVEMRKRAMEVAASNVMAVYGEQQGNKILSKFLEAAGINADDVPRFRINRSGKKNLLATDEEKAMADVKKAAEKWLDELDTVKSGGRPQVIVHGVGQTAQKQQKHMSREEKDSLAKIYSDPEFALKNAYGFRDKDGNIHIFLDQHVGDDGQVDMAEVMRTVYHEYVAHVGLRRTLGAEYDNVMLMVFEKYCNPGGGKTSLTTAQKVHIAEEYFGERAEDIKWDPALGRANNRHIGNVMDKILSMIVRKFRAFFKKYFNKDLKMTGVEVRDIMRQAFAGSNMSGRTGFSAFLSPGLIAGENLTSYAGLARYSMNMIDKVHYAVAAKLLPFERMVQAYMSNPNAIPLDKLGKRMVEEVDFDDMGNPSVRMVEKDIPFGRKVLFDFMSHFSAFKSRAAEMINRALEREKEYAESYKGKDYNSEDVAATGTAIYTLQRMRYEMSDAYRARWTARVKAANARAGRPEPTAAALEKNWNRHLKKISMNTRISGMNIFDVVVTLAKALEKGHLKTLSAEDFQAFGRLIIGHPSAFAIPEKIDPEDLPRAELIVSSVKTLLKEGVDHVEYTGSMVGTLKYVWDAAEEMAAVSAESGMISHADYEEMREHMPNAMVIPGAGGKAFTGIGGVSVVGGNRFNYEQGGPMNAIVEKPNPQSSTFSALRRRHVEAEVNKAVTTLFNFIAYNPNKEVFSLVVQDDLIDEFYSAHRDLAGKSRGVIMMNMLENGISFMSDPQNAKDLPSTIKQQKNREEREGLIPVYIAGKLSYIKIHHKEMAEAFKLHFRPRRVGPFVRTLAGVNRWLISMATLLSPEFWLSNTPRDISMALGVLAMQGNIAGKDGLQFAKDSAKLIPHAMRYLFAKNFKKDTSGIKNSEMFDKYYDSFKRGGEVQWAFMETALKTMAKLESDIRIATGQGTKSDQFRRAKNNFVEFMRNVSGSFENTTRFVVFCAAMEAGLSEDQAVTMARNVTVDFDKKGAYGELFNTLYMFANAGIQANLNIAKLFRNNPGRAAKAAGGIIALSLGMAMMNFAIGGSGDDDEPYYGSIPQETRNSHFMLMLPFTDGIPLKIGFAYGLSFFWGIGQELGSMIFGRSSAAQAGLGMLSSLMKNFNPLETAAGLQDVHGWVRMISPTVTDPLVDILAEKTPFGTPLMPMSTFEGQPDSRRHWRSVTTVSRSLARTMNDWTGGSAGESGLVDISPETLDYMYETVTGGLGKFLARAGGVILSPATGREITVNDVPGIRRFVGGQQKWEARGRFSDNYKQVLGASATYRELKDAASMAKVPSIKARAEQDARDFYEENKHILKMKEKANDTFSRIKKIDKKKERLYKSGLSEREIQPKLRVLDEEQQGVFSDFNLIYYQTVDMN